MTDIKTKQQTAYSVNPLVAGIAGAVVGGAAVAAAIVMGDKKNQKKVGEVIDSAKENISKFAGSVASHPVVEKSTKKVEEVVQNVKEKIDAKK